MRLFESLPKNFAIPSVVLQHMPIGPIGSFATVMNRTGAFECEEAKEGHVLTPGKALFIANGAQVRFGAGGELLLTPDEVVHDLCPSADILFTSAAEQFGSRCIAVVLSGIGIDGAEGAAAIVAAGGQVIVESKETAMMGSMPKAVAASCSAQTASIDQMASTILKTVGKPLPMAA